MTHHVFPPDQPCRITDAGTVGKFPYKVVGNESLPLRVIRDERLDVPLQEIGGGRHRSLLLLAVVQPPLPASLPGSSRTFGAKRLIVSARRHHLYAITQGGCRSMPRA